MNNNIFKKSNYEYLKEFRNLLNNLKNNIDSENDIYLNHDPIINFNNKYLNILKNINITSLYLNRSSENIMIENEYYTVFDIANLKNLKQVESLGYGNINNIRINMLFIENYLKEVDYKNREIELINEDIYYKKYEIIYNNMNSIFKYLDKNGNDYFFANSSKDSVDEAHKILKLMDSNLNFYRIIRCLSKYSFLDDIENFKSKDIDAYKSFDKFIVKRK